MPYYEYKPPPPDVSSSFLTAFGCEQRGAFQYLCTPKPKVAEPIYRAFGVLVHKVHETIWNGEHPNVESALRFAYRLWRGVLFGHFGPEGPGSKPLTEIQWFIGDEAVRYSPEERAERQKDLQKRYRGRLRLFTEVLFTEYEERRPKLLGVDVERSTKPLKLTVQGTSGKVYPLWSKLDRVERFPDDSYIIFDLKSGKAQYVSERELLIQNIQIILYCHAALIIYGKAPRAFLIEALGRLGKDFKDQGVAALEKIRVVAELATPEHIRGVGNLIDDVYDMIRFASRPEEFSPESRGAWEPRSDWAKKAKVVESVVEGRFKPRIGEWCVFCTFRDLCRTENPDDWRAWHEQKAAITSVAPPQPDLVVVTTDNGGQRRLTLKTRPVKRSVEDRVELRGMLESGTFIQIPSARALLVRLWEEIPPGPDGSLCPCKRLTSKFARKRIEVVPGVLIENLPRLYRHRKNIRLLRKELRAVLARCPKGDCPHREPAAAGDALPQRAAEGTE